MLATLALVPLLAAAPAPQVPRSLAGPPGPPAAGGPGPYLGANHPGPAQGDPGVVGSSPGADLAVGPAHVVAVVQETIDVYDKHTGTLLTRTSLATFFGGAAHLPQVHFDPHSQRFVLAASTYSAGAYLAVSRSADPTAAWFTTSVLLASGSDAGKWVYTIWLGVDDQGLYLGAEMVGVGSAFSLFAFEKAPLVGTPPALGKVTAFRNLAWEGSLVPCVTHGASGGELVVSRAGATTLRLRQVQGPITVPTLVHLGLVTVPAHKTPPDVPALGGPPLVAGDGRLTDAVFQGGSVWTAHVVDEAGRAAVRWYEVDPLALALVQSGTVADAELGFLSPSLAANAGGDLVLGFTGASPAHHPSAWFTGRRALDPPGSTAPVQSLRAGEGAYTGGGKDPVPWSLSAGAALDPDDDHTVWTIQEAAGPADTWRTWIGALAWDCGGMDRYCGTTPNSVGPGSVIDAAGTASVAQGDLELLASGNPPGQFGLFFFGSTQVSVPTADGVRCAGGALFRLPAVAIDGSGLASSAVDYAVPPALGNLLPGTTWNFQFWYRDPMGGPAGSNFSDGLSVVFCP